MPCEPFFQQTDKRVIHEPVAIRDAEINDRLVPKLLGQA